MKKIALFVTTAALLVSCTKWENRSTEFKITGVWTGINQEVVIRALPFLDSSSTESATMMEANFMDNGGLTIDSAGTRLDSIGWAIRNDTILVLKNIDLGLGIPGAGGSTANIDFIIKKLEQDALTFRVDTALSITIPGFPIPLNFEIAQIQRWGK